MADEDEARYEELKGALADLGYLRRGSLVRRFMACGKPGCCCQATPPRLHGPYLQWTRKVGGKTVTVRLSPEKASLIEGWIANGRALDKIVAEMENLSMRVTERVLLTISSRR